MNHDDNCFCRACCLLRDDELERQSHRDWRPTEELDLDALTDNRTLSVYWAFFGADPRYCGTLVNPSSWAKAVDIAREAEGVITRQQVEDWVVDEARFLRREMELLEERWHREADEYARSIEGRPDAHPDWYERVGGQTIKNDIRRLQNMLDDM